MFERVVSFLRDLPRAAAAREQDRGDDPRVAAAALMFHVMNADGVRQDVEWDRIKQLLAETYDLEGAELDALVKAAEAADNEAIDLYSFTSVLKKHLDDAGRVGFIRLMWEIVYADGELHELEDNTIWRVAELLGVESRDRVLTRQEAARHAPQFQDPSQDE